jgi:ATPase family associated with various cellular activities (AAA)
MNSPAAAKSTMTWNDANQQHLMSAVRSVRNLITRKLADGEEQASDVDEPNAKEIANLEGMPPYALERLCVAFSLSSFERDILLMCAGVELDSTFGTIVASAQGDSRKTCPTFSLALSALPDAHWSALTPDAPLRRWRLIELTSGDSLTRSPLRIDERVLHYLAGVFHIDERLRGLVEAVSAQLSPSVLPESQHNQAEAIAQAWSASTAAIPVIQLCGDDATAKRNIAAAACAQIGAPLYAMAIQALPQHAAELDAFLRLWQREAVLGGFGLLLYASEQEASDPMRDFALTRVVEEINGPLVIASRARRHQSPRPALTFDIGKPTPIEQRQLWKTVLGDAGTQLNGSLDLLGGQFDLDADAITRTSMEALQSSKGSEALETRLWELCRAQARPRLNGLAERIIPAATWDDLVLPTSEKNTLYEIATHVKHRTKVYETWGFGETGTRGLGISALFTGQSGTGKTMASEVLANELKLDLYRIDLSRVVSKYIGETEDNLRRVFDAAEGGGVILLFDEADALFGKRSEVKDSHDRYANIEVSYLLQRMEAYRGLAILTTNMKDSLDQAFLRRIRFVVKFPFPDAVQRAEIWRRAFPNKTPVDALDYAWLSSLQVSGGNIRSIAMNAAFSAAEDQCAVGMAHLIKAARGEYGKLERPLYEIKTGGAQ